MRKTKIIATIGPASESYEILKKLVKAGLDIVRINASHGDYKSHPGIIKRVRKLEKELKKKIPILYDLQGPKIRTGKLKKSPVILHNGQQITLTTRDVLGDDSIISTSYKRIVKDLKKGDPILLCDGFIELKVLSKNKTEVKCKVIDGGELGERKGMNLPNTPLSLPGITKKDKKDLKFAIRQKVDHIGLSFVRQPADLKQLRKLTSISIVAKIERPEAIHNIDEIIKLADWVMVARGDLGVEMPPEEVPILQKMIIRKCNQIEKPVIVATQMLESMVENERPTRAEASDVANAVFDGANYVMLSEEVSIGHYPVKSVQMMIKIIKQAEGYSRYSGRNLE